LSKVEIFNNIDNDVVNTVAPKALLRAQHIIVGDAACVSPAES
jgi:hypothetical protein